MLTSWRRCRAGVGRDQALVLEPLQRLADRRPPDAEGLRELLLVDRGARADLEHDEAVADGAVGALGEGQLLAAGLSAPGIPAHGPGRQLLHECPLDLSGELPYRTAQTDISVAH